MSKINNKIITQDFEGLVSGCESLPKLKGKKILVTGATGFIGGYITKFLIHLNAKYNYKMSIIATGRSQEKLDLLYTGIEIETIKLDLNNCITTDINNLNYIFHAASQASPKYYQNDPVGTILPNVIGTNNLLELSKKNKNFEGFIFMSSNEVYGSCSDEEIHEQSIGYVDPAKLRSCYAESKRLGEALCIAWGCQHKVPTYIIRLFHTYGPGLRKNDSRVFADFIFNVVNEEHINIKSDGLAERAFCYISDAIRGILYVIFNGQKMTPYNIGNPFQNIQIKELANMLSVISDKKSKVIIKKRSEKDKYSQSNIKKSVPNIKKMIDIGWTPNVTIMEGFQRTIEYYKNENK